MVADGFIRKVNDLSRIPDARIHAHVRRSVDEAPPDREQLIAFFTANLKPYERNVVYLAGHGNGRDIGPIDVDTAAAALDATRVATGCTADILFIEACAMGHLTGVVPFAKAARVAIVSEETIPVDALPTRDMLMHALADESARDIGAHMIETAGRGAIGRSGPRAISALDLAEMETLSRATEHMLVSLATAPHPVVASAIKSAMWYLPRAGKQFGHGDLGGFARRVIQSEASTDEQREAAHGVAEQLARTVIKSAHNGEYGGISGLSFKPVVAGKSYTWWDLLAV